ncbi:membrane protein insertase YidC [Mesonia sp. K7]|uniref:membrane protein insertase YidC n=1 Tax=Mesonia sp. K7 TaxID=2218606 RepID=UPI000DA87EF8|nr:membrane protein insertase YidC [Mesonia sp. K7]PZD79438.1 membrane protein insertase YidC [Mesonia sp. K7]
MEEKKFDVNSLIGFLLIGAVLIWMLYNNQSETPIEDTNTTTQEEVVDEKTSENQLQNNNTSTPTSTNDSIALAQAQKQYGVFGYSAGKASAEAITTLENEVLQLKISNKGGQIVEAKLKQFKTYDSIPVYLIKNGNASFNVTFKTSDNRTISTEDMVFEPKLIDNQTLSMKLKVSENDYLEFYYALKPNDYMFDFDIKSQGLSSVVQNKDVTLDWKIKTYRHAKSISYENRYTEILWEYEGGSDDYSGQGSLEEDSDQDITWVAFKQHFFTSILLTDQAFSEGKFISKNLVDDEDIDTVYTKDFTATLPLALKAGEFNESLDFYYGPSDYKILNEYDRNLDEVIPLGWGIFGWINKYLIIPFYNVLSGFLPAGIAIIFLTIAIKILLSPVQYKQYVSQAKMKVLRPEIEEINEKHKDNAMKRQQETMKLYNKAGASPMSGCIPSLLQIPVFYALFNFFPSAFDIRQKSFLWADDLSSYDVIAELPFTIPFYGDHVSLFPILASIAIFIYMMMTTGQNMQPSQPGMPNMKFIMYISPLFMLFFFNNYASGLSLYYFTSNLITIGIMLVIKNFIIDENKVLAKIEQNKKKPRKQNRFAKKMQEMMEEAEKQKKAKK